MEIKEQLRNIPYLSKTVISTALTNKSPNTIRNFISYWKTKGSLIPLRRGFYVFKDFIEKGDNSLYYARFSACKMIEPSYLSKESILQDYQMLTDVVLNYSVVTIKKTMTISNRFGTFHYQSIKPRLFDGFQKKSYQDLIWYESTKAKALFDFLYFNLKKFSKISFSELNEFRLDLSVMNKNDWAEFKKYLKFAPVKMKKIYELMKGNAN